MQIPIADTNDPFVRRAAKRSAVFRVLAFYLILAGALMVTAHIYGMIVGQFVEDFLAEQRIEEIRAGKR